jgi:hypothetical protein
MAQDPWTRVLSVTRSARERLRRDAVIDASKRADASRLASPESRIGAVSRGRGVGDVKPSRLRLQNSRESGASPASQPMYARY